MKQPILIIDACQYSANYNNCLIDALLKAGVEVIYATTPFPHAESPIPAKARVRYCYFYLARMVSRFTSSHTVRRILRAFEYPINCLSVAVYVLVARIKVVHYMWAVFPAVDTIITKLLKAAGCRIVYTAHNPLPHDFKPSHLTQYARIYKTVDHIIALTDYTRRRILEFSDIAPEKISVIPHGDFNYVFSQFPCNQALVEKVQARAAGRPVISFLGLIRPYKGLEYFIKAFPLIKKSNPDAFFLIAGSARFADREHLDKLLAEYSSGQDCHLDLRYLPISDMKAYLAVTDILVQPYVEASQSGNTIMAYSAGIPVVCTDAGGLPEMVEEGQTGYIVPPKDPAAIARAVSMILSDDNLAKMSESARRLAEQRYNWRDIAARTAEIYRHAALCKKTS